MGGCILALMKVFSAIILACCAVFSLTPPEFGDPQLVCSPSNIYRRAKSAYSKAYGNQSANHGAPNNHYSLGSTIEAQNQLGEVSCVWRHPGAQ